MFMEVQSKRLVVRLDSELDHHYAESIRDEIDSKIRSNNIEHLFFDFSKVKFMDSSGIGVIMGRYKLMNQLGGRVSVFGLRGQMDKIIKMSGIDKLVDVYSTEKQAFLN